MTYGEVLLSSHPWIIVVCFILIMVGLTASLASEELERFEFVERVIQDLEELQDEAETEDPL